MNLISAASYIFAKSQKYNEWCVLCGKRGATAPSCPNMYNVPTGMREKEDGDIVSCAVREVYEETNLNLTKSLFKLIDTEEWARGKFGANFLVVLPKDVTNYHIGNGDGENSKFIWLPLSDLNKVSWAYNMNRTVQKMYSHFNRKERLDNILKEVKIISKKLLKEETTPDNFLEKLYTINGEYIQYIKKAESLTQEQLFNINNGQYCGSIPTHLFKPDDIINNGVTYKEYSERLHFWTEHIYREWIEELLKFKKTCRLPWMHQIITKSIENLKQRQNHGSMLNEMDVYHGTGAKFDQFDHRKKGFSGAGSMSFGWGSYFTNDQVIAQSYADSLAQVETVQEGKNIYQVYKESIPIIGKECAVSLNTMMEQLNDYLKWRDKDLTVDEMLEHLYWCKSQFEYLFKCYDSKYQLSTEERNEYRNNCYKYKSYFVFYESDYQTVYKAKSNLMFYNNLDNLQQDYELFKHYYDIVCKLIKYISSNKAKVQIEKTIQHKHAYIYKVVIPDNDGTNYIDWYEQVNDDIKQKIINNLTEIYTNHSKFNKGRLARWYYSMSKDKKNRIQKDEQWKYKVDVILNWVKQKDLTGRRLYDYITYAAQDISRTSEKLAPRWASTFLRRCGIVGICYKSGTLWKKPDGSRNDAYNYVIFDKRDIKITKVDETITEL